AAVKVCFLGTGLDALTDGGGCRSYTLSKSVSVETIPPFLSREKPLLSFIARAVSPQTLDSNDEQAQSGRKDNSLREWHFRTLWRGAVAIGNYQRHESGLHAMVCRAGKRTL